MVSTLGMGHGERGEHDKHDDATIFSHVLLARRADCIQELYLNRRRSDALMGKIGKLRALLRRAHGARGSAAPVHSMSLHRLSRGIPLEQGKDVDSNTAVKQPKGGARR